MRRLIFLTIMISCLPALAGAAVLRVSQMAMALNPDGRSWQTAYATISEAILAAAPGDEIWVAQGPYADNLYIAFPVSLYGGFAGTETLREERQPAVRTVIIDGCFLAPVVTSIADVTIDGFTLTEGYVSAEYGMGPGGAAVCAPFGSLTLTHCVLQNNIAGQAGSTALTRTEGGAVFSAGPAEIAWNDIRDNQADGAGAVYCEGPNSAVHNNVFSGNASSTASALRCAGERALVYGNTFRQNDGPQGSVRMSSGAFLNNTVDQNSGPALAVAGPGVAAANNCLTANDTGVLIEARGSLTTFSHNNLHGNARNYAGTADRTGTDGNISQDPRYTNRILSVLHIAAESPCRDAGDDAFVADGWQDADGELRRMGRHVDIGADERLAAPPDAVLYVSPNGCDSADGLTWATAKQSLTSALNIAFDGNSVWMAAGTYGAASGDNLSLQMRAGVGLYGGFAGGETAVSQRRPASHLVAIQRGLRIEVGAGRNTVLDGVTAAGLFCADASPVVRDATFAGPVTVNGGAPLFDGCAYRWSGGSAGGAAISCSKATVTVAGGYFEGTRGIAAADCGLAITGASFRGGLGAAVTLTGGRADIRSCTFSGGAGALQAGGEATAELRGCVVTGMAQDGLRATTGASVEARNCVFHTNAQAAAAADAATLRLAGCTIARNGGLDGAVRSSNGAGVALTNCIVALNVAGVSGAAALSHCCVFGNSGLAGTDGVNGDPLFVAAAYGDFHLQPSSPCRDAGSDAAVTSGETDADGQPRVQGAHVDIGAYECDGRPRPAVAVVVRVRPGGDDRNDGSSWPKAKATVAAAVAACPATGSEVWVAAGTYGETEVRLKPGMRLLGGFGGWESGAADRSPARNRSLLRARVVVPVEVSRLGVVDGFTLEGGEGAAVRCEGAARISHNVIRQSAGAIDALGDAYICNNLIIANAALADDTAYSATVSLRGRAALVNNTIAANEGAVVLRDAPVVANNIVALNAGGLCLAPGGAPDVRSNCVWGNAAQGDILGSRVVTADPVFADAAHGNFHVQPASPCANAGDTGFASASDTDMDGQPRVLRGRVDIGADESNGAVWKAAPAVAYARPAGSDRNDGLTWAKAKRTIGAAIAAVAGGGDVRVAGGSYQESVTVPPFVSLYGGQSDGSTRLATRNEGSVQSVVQGAVVMSTARSAVTVQGITVEGGGLTTAASSPFIERCIVRGGGAALRGGAPCLTGCFVEGRVTTDGGAPVISGNRIGGGVRLAQTRGTVVNCAISGARGAGLEVDGGSAWVTGNSIVANVGGVALSGAASVVMANNVVAFNGSGVRTAVTARLTARSNDIYGNAGDDGKGLVGRDGNVSVDPGFVDYPHDDLRLGADSALIDAGDATFVTAGQVDLYGGARIAGPRVDIGAVEWDRRTVAAWPARVVRVRPSGDDRNDGSSWRLAKRTLAAAADALRRAGGGEIWAAEGVYAGPVTLGRFVSLYGGFAGMETRRSERDAAAHETIVDGGKQGSVVTALDGYRVTVVDGCTIRNGAATMESGSAWRAAGIEAGAVVMRGNRISGNFGYYDAARATWAGTAGVHGEGALVEANCVGPNYGGGVEAGAGSDVCRNLILGNVAAYGAGVNIAGAGATVANNIIAGNSAACFGSGITINARDARVLNNTISGNVAPQAGGIYVIYPATVANNIVADNAGGIWVRAAAVDDMVLAHNDVYANGTDYGGIPNPAGKAGNLSKDPRFVDLSNADYRVLPGSPCLDAGDDAYTVPGSLDYAGNPRIRGLHVDIGAIESAM